jgi:integrase
MKLTNTSIKSMVYEKSNNKADLRFDDDLRGFGVRVYPSDRKSFFVSYRNESGTKKRHTIGDFGLFTATNARQIAQEMLTDVKRGADPQDDKQTKRGEITLTELAERYLEHTKDYKKSWKDDAQRMRDHVIPALGHKKLSEVTLPQLQKLHRDIKTKRTPATANRVAALIKHVFTTAGKWSLVTSNPAQHLTMFKEPPPRDIVLSIGDSQKLIEACDADENLFACALFKLAMFTGRRVGELLNAKWTDVNLDAGTLTLPDTKAGERQFVYLNEYSASVLRTLPRIEGNEYIIAGSAPGKPLNFYRRAWKRILNRAGLDYFPPHGLRHNYASTLVAAGVPLETVGHLLGHKNTVTTRKYAHHRPDHLHRAAETFTDVIDFKTEKENRGG